jgi:hypothetical protein
MVYDGLTYFKNRHPTAFITIGKLACDNGSRSHNAALLKAIAIDKGATS